MFCSGGLSSPPEGGWLLRPAALAAAPRDPVSDHSPLSGFSWFVFKCLTEKATSWRGFRGQDLSSSRGSLMCFLSPSVQHKYDSRVDIFC